MATIIPLHRQPDITLSIPSLSRQCERLQFLMDTATDFEAQRTHHAKLERTMLALSQLTPQTQQDATAYSQTAILQLKSMIAAWDSPPTPAEALLLQMLEQLHHYLSQSPRSPAR